MRNDDVCNSVVITNEQLANRLQAAAKADLDVYRRTVKWPPTQIALTLEVDGFDEPVTTKALARALMSLDDLILVAPPGMGKTTTLFQIAESALSNDSGSPLVVHLSDWATEDTALLTYILKRPAFREISEDDFRTVAAKPGVLLLLDGWNELDLKARKRARVQVAALKAELPELGLVIATRKQALDVPFVGTRINLMPLSDEQQMQIATALRDEAGARLVDQAWRTAGVRELVTIPLYLTALLSLPENVPFPTTKEEILRHFVDAHEKDARCAEELHAVVEGFQQDYLNSLAVLAMRTANTSFSDRNARWSILEMANSLEANRQITKTPQPNDVLDVLVSNHVLMLTGDSQGYSFQHQQFQERYASHDVEDRIMAASTDPSAREALKADILNLPVWEEAVHFAVERLARGYPLQIAACGMAILAAFEVDPFLAAEMIFRSSESVWSQIAAETQELISRWHTPGKVDRSVRFMLVSGRPEFIDLIWPLITNDNDQISLSALRNCKQLRPSIFGKDAKAKIKALSPKVRKLLLTEMASRSGMDGLDLVAAIAKDDSDPIIQASVVETLAFRRADRHVAEVLQKASDKTFDLLAHLNLVGDVADEHVRKKLGEALQRLITGVTSTYDQLRNISHADGKEDQSANLTDIISTMEIEQPQSADIQFIYELRNRYPRAVADGLLARLRMGRTLFYGADDILASAGFILEDDSLLQMALADPSRRDDRAEAAASVLGPQAVRRMIGTLLDLLKQHSPDAPIDQATRDAYYGLQGRIAHTPGANLVAAIHSLSAQADNEKLSLLAELICRHSSADNDRGRPFDADSLLVIQWFVQDWGNRMLTSGDAKRWQMANIANLACHAPSINLLPILKRLLDDNLRRYRSFLEEANATGWQPSNAVNEARTPCTHEYMRAFLAIKATQTTDLMREYLTDEHFGVLAAQVLAGQWQTANEPLNNDHFFSGVDFSRVKQKRAARASDPDGTSAEADSIFTVVVELIADGSTDEQKKLGVELGIVAVRLPHGQRIDTIRKLIELTPRRARSSLLLNLVLSGEEIDIKDVTDGINETLEAAKKETWILTQCDGYELKVWLHLLPFVNHPKEALAVVRNMPEPQRHPRFLEEMVAALANSPSADAEEVLFKLAEDDPRFYLNDRWRATVLRFGTQTSAHRFVDQVAKDALHVNKMGDWALAKDIGCLINEYPDVRAHIYDLLSECQTTDGLTLLARAVAETLDEEGMLLLVRFERNLGQTLMSWRTIEQVVNGHVPAENWVGAYNVVPIPAINLRRKLLSMTTDGGHSDVAARYLNEIDKIRDDYGAPETEPRHPDLESGKPWPIMTRARKSIATDIEHILE